MEPEKTVEPQYDRCLDLQKKYGLTEMGLMSNQTWHDDPKRLLFVLARYKFVAKMLNGKSTCLEVGCADAFGSRVVQQHVERLTVSDIDPVFLKNVKDRMNPEWPLETILHDATEAPFAKQFESIYSLDVLEHIHKDNEDNFIKNLKKSLTENGELIIGSPSIYSQPYASPASKAGHINCKTEEELKALLKKHFHNVFMFSMNDEVVHTGYSKMSHYYFAISCNKKG